jgi:hypothetical protein
MSEMEPESLVPREVHVSARLSESGESYLLTIVGGPRKLSDRWLALFDQWCEDDCSPVDQGMTLSVPYDRLEDTAAVSRRVKEAIDKTNRQISLATEAGKREALGAAQQEARQILID